MNICVFMGSSLGHNKQYKKSARELGEALAKREIGLVYGGAAVGLMGTVADAVLEHGGTAVGVLPTSLADLEIAHPGLTDLHIVSSMHERKAQMADLSDAFIVLPGGIGTMEEMFEVWTWSQLGIHRKPLGLLNIAGFYDGLKIFLDHQENEGFVNAASRSLLLADTDPGTLIDRLINTDVPVVHKWVDPINR